MNFLNTSLSIIWAVELLDMLWNMVCPLKPTSNTGKFQLSEVVPIYHQAQADLKTCYI